MRRTCLCGVDVVAPLRAGFRANTQYITGEVRDSTGGVVPGATVLAVVLLPARSWMQRRTPPRPVRRPRAAVHDAERARRAARTGRRPARAAHEARRGRARRARRVVGADPAGVDGCRARRGARSGVGGDVAGEPVESCDLVRGDETLGRIEVGPRRRGEYGDAERTLLRTVAGQAAASVANVRLTAQLAEQLDELRASRERLVAAQDDERRRIERDLHDGIQQHVVAQIAGLRLARNRLQRGRADARRAGRSCRTRPGRRSPTCASSPTASTRRC